MENECYKRELIYHNEDSVIARGGVGLNLVVNRSAP